MSSGGGTKAIFAAMSANAGIAVAKFVAFAATGSASMLAEGIHSVADTSNQGLLLLGGRRASRRATSEHPFGFGRERYFWSFIVALVLFSLGGLFALFEGYEKIQHPHELERPAWAIGVLVFAILAEGYSFRTAVAESSGVRGDRGWIEFIRTAKQPELPVVLLEDTGALIGLVLALLGVGLTLATGDTVWDGLGTMAIGTLLVLIAGVLAVEMKSLLIGESVTEADRRTVVDAIEGSPELRRLIHLRTEHLGPDEVLVTAKVELDPDLTFREVADAIDVVEARVRSALPSARLIYLEPDVYDPAHDAGPGTDES